MKKIPSIIIIGILILSGLGAGASYVQKSSLKQSAFFDEYDMMVIATDIFTDAIQPLIVHKNSVGIETFLKTTEEIYDECEGRDEAELDLQYNNEDVISVTIRSGEYQMKRNEKGQEIFVENFGRLLVPGKPNIPSKIFAVAIPPGAELVEVDYDAGEGIILPGTFEISPVSLPIVIDKENPFIYEQEKQMYEENFNMVYGSDEPYPSSVVEFVRTANYRKYNLVDVRITPFTYYPFSGRLIYYPEITVHVIYKMPEEVTDVMVDNLARAERVAEEFILNYDRAKNWYPSNTAADRGTHDFVIITLDSLTSSVTPLVDWETSKGRTVEVVTTSWIDSNYNGYDLAEKIRNFLREKYPSEEWGIQDLLIIGHRDDIPMRLTWQDVGGGKPETDFYYAELSHPDNQSWDANGNHQYGENSDPIDYYSEINVGRIPWSDAETVQHICEKSANYERNNDPSFKNNILLLGVSLDDQTDGATLMEYIADSSHNPWMSSWMKTRIYERKSQYEKDYPMSHSTVVNVWSSGKFSVVCWCSHRNPNGTGFIYSYDCSELNDQYPSIVAAAQCSASDTDYLNIGQAMMKQGAIGFIGANKLASYCSAWSNPDDGSGQSFYYFFTMAVTSANYTQGQALQYALREMYTRNLWSIVLYETFIHSSLWGNPDLGIAPTYTNNIPEKPYPPNGPCTGKIKREYTYTTSATDPEGEQLYYCWSWGDRNVEWIGPYNSEEEISTTHTWSDQGEFEIKVKVKDIHGGESEWSDPLVVSMPKNRMIYPSLFRFLDNHLHLFPILQRLLLRFGLQN